jgi:hypothetical protein
MKPSVSFDLVSSWHLVQEIFNLMGFVSWLSSAVVLTTSDICFP